MYIATKLNLTTLLPELIKRAYQGGKEPGVGRKSPNERIEHYMSQLDASQKGKLFELYRLDFDLFGYEPLRVI